MLRVNALVLALAIVCSACSASGEADDPGADIQVLASTGIIADLVDEIAGERVTTTSFLPAGADPHTFEPSPGDVRHVAEADLVFSNGLLLESGAATEIIDTNVRPDAVHIKLAEATRERGGQVIPLDEPVGGIGGLLWLGLEAPIEEGILDDDLVTLSLADVVGPGDFALYVTHTLGDPEVYMDTGDGIGTEDAIRLRAGAHTHLNWAFAEPGSYELTLRAIASRAGSPEPIAEGTYLFDVLESTSDAADGLTTGHVDIAFEYDGTRGTFVVDDDERGDDRHQSDAVRLIVPLEAQTDVPADDRYAFLGEEGAPIWVLPQRVTGKHEHGEDDPHLWMSVDNAQYYAEIIRDVLVETDPEGAPVYRDRYDRFVSELDDLRVYVAEQVETIPREQRQIVTTHDAFGYLADEFGFEVLGFIVPSPGQEPSAQRVAELQETVAQAGVRAVFVEPQLHAHSDVLIELANSIGIEVCTLYGDAFDQRVTTYLEMMRFNADELARCLGPSLDPDS
jgi:anchored repeat ABC transporter substrate-binding protein